MEKKICRKCNIEKELSEFYKCDNGRNYMARCKDCNKLKKQDYYKNNKEKIVEYKRKYYQNNKEKIAEYRKKYYENNREKIEEHRKLNKEKIADWQREYHLNNTLDHYIVYYLPKINYCGVTQNPQFRMSTHRTHGNDTTGWEVLNIAKTKKEALEIESKYHSEKGMNGARGWKLQSKNG